MRVIVVGCGAVGAATALAAVRAGHEVLVLERFAPATLHGSSHGHARIFRLAYPEPHHVHLAREALAGWRAIEQQSGRALLATTGTVDHGEPEALEEIRAAMAAAGEPTETLRAAAATARWPGLRFAGDALVDPAGGRLDAELAVRTMLELAVAGGAVLRTERALEVEPGAVTTDAAPHEADAVVVAAGAWTGALVPALGGRAPVVTLEQPVTLAPRATAAWPSFIHHRADAPPIYGLFEPGAGLKVGEHGNGRVVDPDDLDRTPDPAGVERLRAYAAGWLPGADPARLTATGCLYDSTPDHEFLIERLPDGLVVAAGTSGHGFKFAPALGERAAALAAA